MKFTHLHVHSHYSLLDGLPKIEELVNKAKECNMDSLAITDHGVMYGVIEFYQECKKAGIKPIIGVEFYVAPNGRLNKRPKIDEKRHHLILLAKNEQGYKNLLKLTTLAHLEGFYYKPRVDLELLKKYNEGLIAMTSCLKGEVPYLIICGQTDQAREVARHYQEIYGQGNFYLEVQHHPNLLNQKVANEALFEISKETGIPCVAANDVHYLNPEDAEAQDILLCLQTKKKREDTDRLNMMGEDFSFRASERMIEDFRNQPEAIENTQRLAEACNLEIELGKIRLPHFDLPKDVSAEKYLEELCKKGLEQRYGFSSNYLESSSNISNDTLKKHEDNKVNTVNNLVNNDESASINSINNDINFINPSDKRTNGIKITEQTIRNRLSYELTVIEKTGFAPYFLIVQDFVNWAKNNGIVMGPGRGSAAGSIVSYLLNITDIDPISYDLLFERFLNPERISMPDIDLDFADTRRDEVIDYVAEKYGKDHVSQIITFGTMAARAAVRDVGRVLNMSYNYCDGIAKMIPGFKSLDQALEINSELKEIYDSDSEAKRLIDTAKKLEGVARHASTHACGVLITEEQLDNYVPLQYDSTADGKTIVSQYSMKPIEELGLLKMDFLGLKNLTIMENTLKLIKYNQGLEIDLDNIPLDEPKTFELLQAADTTGVFQLESAGMKRYLKQLKPTELEDIIAMVSLYRPGPMEWIPDYIDGKHGKKTPHYLHPKLAPILEKTYGVAIYQEQILKIARDLAGFTLGEADILRKAVGKKIKKLLQEQKEKFIEGCLKNGVDKEIAKRVFTFIEPFAGYGFNRSHGACYAMIAYQTAYLKANYPAEFMASLLTSDQQDTDRIAIEVEECREMGIEVLPPDINESRERFTVVSRTDNGGGDSDKRVRFGLLAIKNVGEHIVEVIVRERRENGPYQNLEDFLGRVQDKDLNKKSLESLIKSGALDSFGERNQLLFNLDSLLNYHKQIQKEINNGQANLFGIMPQSARPFLTLRAMEAIDKRTKLSWEKELLGLYISEHPFREFEEQLQNIAKRTNEFSNEEVGAEALIITAGVITGIKKIITRSNEPMLFVKIEDTAGTIETLVFPRLLQETQEIWVEEKAVAVGGKLSNKDGVAKILCDKVWELEQEGLPAVLDEIKNYPRYNGYKGNYGNRVADPGKARYSMASKKQNIKSFDSTQDRSLNQTMRIDTGVNKPVNNINGPDKRIEITVPNGLNQEKSTALKTLIKENEGGDNKICFLFPNIETKIAKKIVTNSHIKFNEEIKRKIETITGKDSVKSYN